MIKYSLEPGYLFCILFADLVFLQSCKKISRSLDSKLNKIANDKHYVTLFSGFGLYLLWFLESLSCLSSSSSVCSTVWSHQQSHGNCYGKYTAWTKAVYINSDNTILVIVMKTDNMSSTTFIAKPQSFIVDTRCSMHMVHMTNSVYFLCHSLDYRHSQWLYLLLSNEFQQHYGMHINR